MIKKSAGIYFSGFAVGTIICFLLIQTFPGLYLALINLLIKKIAYEIEAGRSFHLNVSAILILNNISASFIMSYGGVLLSRIYMKIGGIDMKSCSMMLQTFPVFVLFLNGFVLGAFLVLYLTYFSDSVLRYLSGIFPHGIFEIPGIVLSGALGLEVAKLGKSNSPAELKGRMNDAVAGTLRRYLVVVALVVVGGLIEGSTI